MLIKQERDRMIRHLIAAFSVITTRFCLTAWVGGAALFVITSVAEQTSPEFDSVIRDQLATIRFPLYYLFGAVMLTTAMAGGLVAIGTTAGSLKRRLRFVVLFTLLSALCAMADYFWIYRPLQTLIVPPGQTRTQQFITLHTRSRHANEVHITLALIAAILANAPVKTKTTERASVQQ